LDDAWRHLSHVEAALHRHFSDADHLMLALCWAVAVRRARAGHVLLSREAASPMSGSPEFAAVYEAADLLERETGFHLPSAEREHLSLEVRTSSLVPMPAEERPLSGADETTEIASLARQIASEIGERVNEDLRHPEVLDRLAEHLGRAVDRARHGLSIRNPLLTQVREAYPGLWQAAADVLEALSARIGVPIPAEEVGYVTMYMGMAHELNLRLRASRRPQVVVVCPTGGVTVWMMVSRLQQRLPEIDVVEITSVRNLSRLDPSRVDAVISTAQITCKNVPVIIVSPLMRENDIHRIRAQLAGRFPAAPQPPTVAVPGSLESQAHHLIQGDAPR
jgi:hypothetical protein